MADKKVTVILAGSAAGAVKAFEEAAVAADASAVEMGAAFDRGTTRIGNVFQKLGTTLGSWGVPLSGSLTKMGNEMAEAESKSAKFSATLSAVGKLTAVVGIAGFAVLATESTKMATSFQASMEMLNTQAGVPQAQIGALSDLVLKTAGAVATSPESLATALYHIESTLPSTISATDRYTISQKELTAAAQAAKVGHADLESVTNALTAAVSSGIPGVQNMQQAVGALNATVGAGDMKMQDLADAMGGGMVAVVKGFGLSLNDVGAALATFGDNNIRGADAGTALRMSVQALAKPVVGGAAAFKHLNMTQQQLAQDMATGGLNKAVIDLHDHLQAAGVTSAQTGEILTQMFGKKAGTGINVLMGQYDRFETKTKEVAAGANSFGKSYEATTKTLSYQMDTLKATVEALATRFGLWLIPKLEEAAKVTAEVISWFEKHSTVAKILGGVIGGVLLVAVGAYTVSMITAAAATVAATWPVLAVIAGVAALGVGIYELATHWHEVWDDIKRWTLDAWHFVDDILHNKFVQIALAFVAPWVDVAMHWRTIWADVRGATEAVWHALDQVFQNIVHAFENVGHAFENVGHAISNTFHAIRDVAGATWDFVWNVVLIPWRVAFALSVDAVILLGRAFGATFSAISSAVGSAWQWMNSNVFAPLGHFLSSVIGAALNAAKGAFDSAWAAIRGTVSTAWSWLNGNVFSPLSNFFGVVITGALDAAKSAFDVAWNGIKDTISGVWAVIQPILATMKRAIDDTIGEVGKVANAVGGAVGGAEKIGKGIMSHIPHFAEGGVVTAPTLALLGEGGEREYVVPESKLAALAPAGATGPLGTSLGRTGGVGGVTLAPVYNITVQGGGKDAERKFEQLLKAHTDDLVQMLSGRGF